MPGIDVFEFKGSSAMSKTISNTAVSDQSDGTVGKVRLTCSAHGFKAGSLVYLSGFTGDLAYLNGLKKIVAVATNTFDVLIRLGQYAAGTPAGTEKVRCAVSLNEKYHFIGFELHLSAAATTSEDFEISRDANAGAEFDSKIYDQDMSGLQDIVNIFTNPIPCEAGDLLVATYDNSDGRTWGFKLMLQRDA